MSTEFTVTLDDLSRLRPLQTVRADDLKVLLPLAKGVAFDAGEHLIAPGKPNTHAWLLLSGRLSVAVETDEGPRNVGDVWPGEIVGEAAFFHPEVPHRVRVTASTPARAIDISSELLESARGTEALAAMQRYLLAVLARRIRSTNSTIQKAWHEQRNQALAAEAPTQEVEKQPRTLGERLAKLFGMK
ncbi:MAG: Crp/Fnr family transcriptional regulator [Alphaproteobacteria bacterium]|nr:Crp/Fnr family transcriptional regulator [Alphaproteobacteria bacterium]